MVKPPRQNQAAIWAISWMSFCWSFSSLMVFSILPAYLADVIKVSHTTIGILEGVAMSAAFLAKIFSGFLSDLLGNRLFFIFVGSLLTTLSKGLLSLAVGASSIFTARFLDRFSKGIRSAPSEALLSELASKKFFGTTYGLRQSLYTLGAVLGALCSMVLMIQTNNHYKLIFTLSIIPAAIATVLALYFMVSPQKEMPQRTSTPRRHLPLSLHGHWQLMGKLPLRFWKILGIFSLLMMARFSEAFLSLRAKELGCTVSLLPMVIIIMDIVHALIAFPSGKISDQTCHKRFLLGGFVVLIVANFVVMVSNSLLPFFVGVALAGAHMGITQGLIRTMIAESTPPTLRGTAFSFFYLVTGLSILFGNSLAGLLADTWGLDYTFLGGALITTGGCSLLALEIYFPKAKSHHS